jgi:hypothetical protein
MSKGDVRYYTDSLIVETLLTDSAMTKSAQASGMLSGAASMISEYASAHMDPQDKVGSIINMLAPAGIFKLFGLFGHSTLGMVLGVVASALHINVGGMVESLFNSVKDTLEKGQKVSPSQIDSAVSQTVQQNTPQDQSPADDLVGNSVAQDLREARMLRLAVEQYNHQILRLTKEDNHQVLFSYGANRTTRTTSLIGRLLGWIFKTVLMSAGFLVAGDEAAKLVGGPNALDKTWHAGQPSGESAAAPVPAPVTTQTKFKPTGTGADVQSQPWEEHITNDAGSIENMLIDFTKQVYSGLDGHEDWIRSSPTFQAVKNQIAWYNHTAAGEPMVYIPVNYSTKKTIVDHYIDEVAKNAA